MRNQDEFEYTYSAKRQAEINKIRNKYIVGQDDVLEQLRKLDATVERPGTVVSLVLGVLGTLVFGLGMCCTMLWAKYVFILGLLLGVVGIVMIAMAYPMYMRITKKQKEKYMPKIVELLKELEE